MCFVAPNAYPALSGKNESRHIGGAEVQQTHIARELARRGRRIAFITHNHGQRDGEEIDGIHVFFMCSRSQGLPGLRFIKPRWTSLCAAMNRANAAVYYQRTGGVETGQVAMWCRWHGRPMIAALANDRDCFKSLRCRLNRRERWLQGYGLRRADVVVAQTAAQVEALQKHFGVNARIIRSCAADRQCVSDAADLSDRLSRRRIVWAARFTRAKRLDWLLQVAQRCPDVQFNVLGGDLADAERYCRSLDTAAEYPMPPNVKFNGVQSRELVQTFLDEAAALLCTSEVEGFPNTFLEAWSGGLPVVSTFDPDGVIKTEALGAVASGVDQLSREIQRLLTDESYWRQCSSNARRHFEQHHTICAVGDAYESLLDELVALPA